jgi:hypothetical protein
MHVYIYIYIYVMCFRNFGLYEDVGVLRVCSVGGNALTCFFFGVKRDVSNFLSFSINVDVM